MKLSIIVPVYNEGKTVITVLSKLESMKLKWQKEIIIVNDGSTDTTLKKIWKFLSVSKNKKIFRIINHSKNFGKGKSIRSGLKNATGDFVLIQDADLEYSPEDIPRLIKSAEPASAVYGNRFTGKQIGMPLLYRLGNKFLTLITNLLYKTDLQDMETGYKLLPGSFIKKIDFSSSHFDIEPEITAKLVNSGYRIKEVPISYKGRTHLAGKKLNLTDAVDALRAIILNRFPRFDLFVIILFLLVLWSVYSLIAVLTHNHFQTFGWDLGYFDQIIWKLSNFIYPYSTLNDVNFLANHFSPVLLINAFLYKLWPDPRILLLSQAFLVCLAGFFLYLVAKEMSHNFIFSFSVVFSYVFFLGTQWSILNEFHEATYTPLFIALFFYAALKNKTSLLYASIIGLLFTKEEFSLLVASLSFPLFYIFERKRLAVGLFFFSLVFFFFLTEIFMPAISEKGSYQHAHLSAYAQTPLDFAIYLFNSPDQIFKYMFTPPQKIHMLMISFASFAFLPIFAPLSIIAPSAEQFLMRLLYSGPQFTVFANVNHHAAPISMLLPIAAVFAVVRFKKAFPKKKDFVLLVSSVFLLVATVSQDFLFKAPIHSIFKAALYRKEEWMNNASFIIGRIPKDVSVSAQNSLFPHLSQRREIYLFPDVREAQYIAVDFNDGPNKYAPADLSKTKLEVERLLRDGTYIILESKGDSYLLKRNLLK